MSFGKLGWGVESSQLNSGHLTPIFQQKQLVNHLDLNFEHGSSDFKLSRFQFACLYDETETKTGKGDLWKLSFPNSKTSA